MNKFINFIFVAVAMFCLSAFSFLNLFAVTEDEKSKLAERLHVPVEYLNICEMFYDGMDFVYEKMKNADDSVRQNGNYFRLIQPELNEFFKSEGRELPGYVYNADAQATNPEVKVYLDRLRNVKPMNLKSLDSYIDSLGIVNQDAKANLSESQAKIVYGASCVQFASTVYWMGNIQKWLELKTKK